MGGLVYISQFYLRVQLNPHSPRLVRRWLCTRETHCEDTSVNSNLYICTVYGSVAVRSTVSVYTESVIGQSDTRREGLTI